MIKAIIDYQILKTCIYGVEVIVFEPEYKDAHFFDSKVIKNIEQFKVSSDLIVTNRMVDCLIDVRAKVFSRDLFGDNQAFYFSNFGADVNL